MVLIVFGGLGLSEPVPAQEDWLPDLIVRTNNLYDHDLVTNIIPGHLHLRLSNGTPNVGMGKLYFYGVLPPINDSTQQVMQRVFRSDGSSWDREAGVFRYHANHGHIHFEGWCQYRLREVLPGDGVGDVVAQGEKVSFCVLDLAVHDNSLPNYSPTPEFASCGATVQGLSVGWYDIYTKELPDQWIDVTGVPEGTYWLESEVDPDNLILESDETNNAARIKVVVGIPEPINPDPYEPNASVAEVNGHTPGAPNSPNLGPCDPQLVIDSLTIHASGNQDYYKFYCAGTGTGADFVRVDFVHAQGDVDMRLYDSTGASLAVSQGTTNSEQISLNGRPRGWYFVNVYGYSSATCPAYKLTINPPSNSAPGITVVDPPLGDQVRVYGYETYTAIWTQSDPESDPTWVTVLLNTAPILDGNEFTLASSINTPGAVGLHVINSAEFDPGTYWVYCRITDGGTTTGAWSDGTLTFAYDSDGDGVVDANDNCPTYPNPGQEGCGSHGDVSGDDGVIDATDLQVLIDHIFFGGGAPPSDEGCPHLNRGDFDCNGADDAVDLGHMIDHVFFGGAGPCNPCACVSYPSNCP